MWTGPIDDPRANRMSSHIATQTSVPNHFRQAVYFAPELQVHARSRLIRIEG